MKTMLLIFSIIVSIAVCAQTSILLSFEAEEILSGTPLSLDSVLVKNLDKDCDTMLFGGAPLLIDVISGDYDHSLLGESAQPHPNPFYGNTALRMISPNHQNANLFLSDLDGNILFYRKMILGLGAQTLDIQTSKNITLLTVTGRDIHQTCKLFNLSPGNINSIDVIFQERSCIKSSKNENDFIYQNGDELLFMGYSEGFIPDSINDSPLVSTLYTFLFEELPPPQLPLVETLHIYDIQHTMVTGGGDVIHDGWSPVFARGLCWSTDPEPTIGDNLTTEGSGVGEFFSTMMPLDTNTSYFFRAYATNSVGTSYGEAMSFSSKSDIPCPGLPEFTYGGQVYQTVLIGDQCWMKQHINIGNMILDSEIPEDNGIIEKWCYDDDPENCNTYGGLYNWDEVMQYSTTAGSTGICPEGWHIPTIEELNVLEGRADSQYPVGDPIWTTFVRGYDVCTNLKSMDGWISNGNGTDVYGFNGLPAGYRWPLGDFTQIEAEFLLWSSSEVENNSDLAFVISFRDYENRTILWDPQKVQGYSVRCVHNDSFSVKY